MTTFKGIETELTEVDAKIQKLQDEIKQLESRRRELRSALTEDKKYKATRTLLNTVFEVNAKNSMNVQLYSDIRTTPIMDAFCASGQKFLIFRKMYTLSFKAGLKQVSLIVTGSCSGVQYNDNGLTMTDLKKTVGAHISQRTIDYLNENNRRYALYKELVSICKRVPKDDTSTIIPFQTPCRLGGQTFSNQSGYGSEYCGEDLVYQGTLYGETTKFLIIGVLVE